MSKEQDVMFEAKIYDLKQVLGSDVSIEGVADMDQAYAMVMGTSEDDEVATVFLTCDEDIEAMAGTLEKIAIEIRTLKKSSMSLH